MRALPVLLLALLLPLLPAQEQVESALDGPALMARVRAQLPSVPLRMTGFVRTREGRTQTDRPIAVELRFGDSIPNAGYLLTDAFGDPLVRVRVSWPHGRAVFERFDNDGAMLDPPQPTDRVGDTGLLWGDLTLDFLWWEGAEITGAERVKTRPSHLVRIPAPDNRGGIRYVRLWVDQTGYFVVRAEFVGERGRILRRFEVDSIKEIREDFWMVKDVIIRDYENNRRMGVRFESVEEVE